MKLLYKRENPCERREWLQKTLTYSTSNLRRVVIYPLKSPSKSFKDPLFSLDERTYTI